MGKTEKMKPLKQCLCCGSKFLSVCLDLGYQPLANSKFTPGQDCFPLKLYHCDYCSHAQLSHSVNPDLMFKDYSYVSGTSQTLHKFFEKFAYDTVEKYQPTNVLDIACNDGTQLDYFRENGIETWGIDPSSVALLAAKKGHRVLNSYFDSNLGVDNLPKFDIILAQNVFAHVPDPHGFLSTAKKLLSPRGKILIQTSQANMIQNNEFDTIYHEHISYFNPASMTCLIRHTADLYLQNTEILDIHGKSYLFTIGFDKPKYPVEYHKLLITKGEYNEFSNNALKIASEFRAMCNMFRNLGYKLIGYGAAAKGNTFLNFSQVRLDAIIDDNPLKQGTLTSGMQIPIVPPESLRFYDQEKKVFIILAWNFKEEIKDRIYKLRSERDKDMFPNQPYICYFPTVRMEF